MNLETIEPYNFASDLSASNFKRFFKYCSDLGASDILIQGGDYIWADIHGRQRKVSKHIFQQGNMSHFVSLFWQSDVESCIRSGSGADRELEISGEEFGIARGTSIRLRCNFIQGRVARLDCAYAITMRFIPSKLPNILEMGIEPALFEAFYPSKGLGLICGPTGSGKTTLQAGIYAYSGRAMPDRKVITYEDPIEFVLGGEHWLGPQPHQAQVGRDVKSFAVGIRNSLRRCPSIVGIGEMRDLETMDAAIEIGLTGHLCFGTVHTDSCAETINRIIQLYPSQQQHSIANRLLGCLRFIVVQRLMKTSDGRRKAIREYVVFDRDFRDELQKVSFDQWAWMIRNRLESEGRTLEDMAWGLLVSNQITTADFIDLAGRKEFDRRNKASESISILEAA